MRTCIAAAAVALLLATAGTSQAYTIIESGPILGNEGLVTPLSDLDISTVEINGSASDGGGMLSYGFTAISDIFTFETNSLNPIRRGFAKARVTWSQFANGGGTIYGTIGGAALAAGKELTFLLAAGQTAWLNISWEDVKRNRSNFDIRLEAAAVPLPGAALFLLTGLGGLGFLSRYRLKTAKA